MLRVLVVDDTSDIIESLQWLLQGWGHEARVAANGPTALKMVEVFHPDVVILDLAMPGMDGYEVAKRLRQLKLQKLLIIVLSGYCADQDVRRSLEVGCNYHIRKPAQPDEIKRILESCERVLQRTPPAEGRPHRITGESLLGLL